jgi:hypothetical protein
MREVNIQTEPEGTGFWAYQQRSAGESRSTPLTVTLRWILEQLNFGNAEWEQDRNGDHVTLVLGKRSSPQNVTENEVVDHVGKRLNAVGISGILARSRESGTSPTPDYADLVRQTTLEADESGHRNTELYYAFELVKVLGRIAKKIFKLEAPATGAPDTVAWYLGEATRCWLYSLHGASIALCRACLEESLKEKLGNREFGALERQSRFGKVTLEMMIDRAVQFGHLDGPRGANGDLY